MRVLKQFNIQFLGLELGEHVFEYELDDAFFSHFGEPEFEPVRLQAKISFEKKSNGLDVEVEVDGPVVYRCDLSDLPFEDWLHNSLSFVVKYGDSFDDSNEEVLILPKDAHEFNVAQHIYDAIMLAVPLKKVHPNLENTEEGREMLQQLKRFEPGEATEDKSDEETDPRWDKLKDLLD